MIAVNKQLDQILMEDDDTDNRGFITAKDFMNDFATEDFISKNIRVRPVSGVTRAVENDETKNAELSKGDGNVESEEKFNDDIRFELEKDRKLAKDRKREFEKRKAAE